MNTEKPAKRRMYRATWIGLGMTVGLGVALAWLLGWGADPAPPVPQVGKIRLSDGYPQWHSPGANGTTLPPGVPTPPFWVAIASPPGLSSLDGFDQAKAEHVPWLLWRARQKGNPLQRMVRDLLPRLPIGIQSRLPNPGDVRSTESTISSELVGGMNAGGLRYADILREVCGLPHGQQRRLVRMVRGLGEEIFEDRAQAGEDAPKWLLRLVREGDPALQVLAGVQLLELYPDLTRDTGDVHSVLLQRARADDGESADWVEFARLSVKSASDVFGFDPILEELGREPDSEVALWARVALSLRSRPADLAALVRAEVRLEAYGQGSLLVNFLANADLRFRLGIRPEVAPELVSLILRQRLRVPTSQTVRPRHRYTLSDRRYVFRSEMEQKPEHVAAGLVLLDMGTNALSVAPDLVHAVRSNQIPLRDALVAAAKVLGNLRHHISIYADERILRELQDPFLTEPILDVIGSGGRTNAHAFAAVAPFLRSEVSGIRRAAFEAAIRIHEPDAELWVHVRESLQDPVRQDLALAVVPQFGAQAREVLPRLREIASDPSEARGMAEMRRLAKEAIQAVEAGGAGP